MAALVVVAYHLMNVDVMIGAREVAADDGWRWWATWTPLHVPWLGEEAVFVFFVLSGFVLTLPALRGAVRWRGYFPARLVRLYVPVWGSLVLAGALALAVPRIASPHVSWWINRHALDVTWLRLAKDAVLLTNPSWLNTPLWSLRYEIWFSLLLPLYVWAALRARSWWPAKVVLLLALAGIGGWLGSDPLLCMPVFGLGVVLAVEREQVARLLRSTSAARGVLVAGLLMLLARWAPGLHGSDWVDVLVIAGAAAVVAAVVAGAASGLLQARWAQVAGRYSYSLYLVHLPVVVSTALLVDTVNTLLVAAVSLPLMAIATVLFYRLVEQPATKAAKAVSGVAQAGVASRGAQVSQPARSTSR